jgi:meso-butanediol dehydrogenase/(S,S)-butanediol dehydrogenase/diacetyl reductase
MALRGLPGKVVIVTGGASGIGRATVARLIEEGAYVAIVDVDDENVFRSARELGEDKALAVTADVSVPTDVDRYFAATIERFGRVDGLFNNAAIVAPVLTLAEVTLEAVERVFSVNVFGVFLGLRKMLGVLAEQRSPGVILNTSSGLALRGVEKQGPYAASKAAVVSLTRTAAREAGPAGIRVNAILPGPTETRMYLGVPQEMRDEYAQLIPLGRNGKPEEVAALAAWLLSEESSNVTGAAYLVDGGEGS